MLCSTWAAFHLEDAQKGKDLLLCQWGLKYEKINFQRLMNSFQGRNSLQRQCSKDSACEWPNLSTQPVARDRRA